MDERDHPTMPALIVKARQWGNRPLFQCPICKGYWRGVEFFLHACEQ